MSSDFLSVAFVGDVCLGFRDSQKGGDCRSPDWRAIRKAIGAHDFLIGNLECCLVDERCDERARAQPMAVPSAAASLLRDAGFSHLSLANNHMLDCGGMAISVTRERLSSLGIPAFGAGTDLSQAEETVFAECNGCKIAFLSACDSARYYATETRPGIAPLKKTRLGRRVRAAAANAELVVVTLHADLEFSEVPGLWRQRLSRWLIEQGAHLVIQHHPHVLQGIEQYRDGLIAYSLGNFIFKLRGNCYQEDQAGVFDSVALVVDVDLRSAEIKLTHRIVPVRIADDHFPRCLSSQELKDAVERFDKLSQMIENRSELRRMWFRRCLTEANVRLHNIYYAFARSDWRHAARQAWRLIARRQERRWILGLLSLGYF